MDKVEINDYMLQVNDISFCLIQLIKEYSNVIYKLKKEKSSKILLDIINRLDVITKLVTCEGLVDKYRRILKQIPLKLPILLNAFENSDALLISDILNYEIKPLLVKLN